MKLKSFTIIALGLLSSTLAFSQEEKVYPIDAHEQRISLLEDAATQAKKLKFSGYIQAQWQSSQLDSALNKSNDMKVGIGINGPEKVAGRIAEEGRRGAPEAAGAAGPARRDPGQDAVTRFARYQNKRGASRCASFFILRSVSSRRSRAGDSRRLHP